MTTPSQTTSNSEEIQKLRAKWEFRGQCRPPFAKIPQTGQESVWDYPRPPVVRQDSRLVEVKLLLLAEEQDNGIEETKDHGQRQRDRHGAETTGNIVLVASSTRAIRVCETAGPPVFYVPFADVVDWTILKELPQESSSSLCEWKGQARYWVWNNSINNNNNNTQTNVVVAWDYPNPFPEYCNQMKEYLAFYPGRIACFVGGERVRPQPGGYYGGWMTNEIVGPVKGESGTEMW